MTKQWYYDVVVKSEKQLQMKTCYGKNVDILLTSLNLWG
jgi:hypothetical protein